MIIQSLDKPLMGAALEGKEQRKGTKLRFPGPKLREKRVWNPGLQWKGQRVGEAWAWQDGDDLVLASFQKP